VGELVSVFDTYKKMILEKKSGPAQYFDPAASPGISVRTLLPTNWQRTLTPVIWNGLAKSLATRPFNSWLCEEKLTTLLLHKIALPQQPLEKK